MAAIALVLLSTEPGREQQVVNELNKMVEVSEAMVLIWRIRCVLQDYSGDFSPIIEPHFEKNPHPRGCC
jgi:hypothetical protein